jgi:hypothetical protein
MKRSTCRRCASLEKEKRVALWKRKTVSTLPIVQEAEAADLRSHVLVVAGIDERVSGSPNMPTF